MIKLTVYVMNKLPRKLIIICFIDNKFMHLAQPQCIPDVFVKFFIISNLKIYKMLLRLITFNSTKWRIAAFLIRLVVEY